MCRWGPAKSHSDLWREHISDVGVGNLAMVGFADVPLHEVFGTWVRRPQVEVCGNAHVPSSSSDSRRARVRTTVP